MVDDPENVSLVPMLMSTALCNTESSMSVQKRPLVVSTQKLRACREAVLHCKFAIIHKSFLVSEGCAQCRSTDARDLLASSVHQDKAAELLPLAL